MTTTKSDQHKLRIAVMLDSLVVPKWVRKILSDIEASKFARLTATLLMGKDKRKGRRLAGVARVFRSLLFHVYERLDRVLFRAENDAFQPVDASDVLDQTETIRLTPTRDATGRALGDDDVALVRSKRLDVILAFGSADLTGRILGAARCGVWSFHHGDPCEYRGSPPLFWEIYDQNPVTVTALVLLTEGPCGKVIYRSYAATDCSTLYRSRNATYWKTSEFMLRRLRDLWKRGWDHIASLETYQEEPTYDRALRSSPGNWTMIRFLARLAYRYLHNRYITLLLNIKWFLAIRPRRQPTAHRFDPTGFEVIEPPKGRFWADPFLLKVGPETHVFFEDVAYAKRRGVISHFKIAPDGSRTEPNVVLERNYHLSYPFVFEWNDQIYMIPETGQNRTVELYKATDFPLRWELVKVLFNDVYAVDATLLEQDGRFWLFVNMSPSGGASDDELFLFYADSPLGRWTPHAMNPIVSDVRRARPAGRPFRQGPDLIRPSQDCSTRYGHAIVLNKIETLSEGEYRETIVGRVESHWHPGCIGTHTLNRGEDYEIVDGYVLRWRWQG